MTVVFVLVALFLISPQNIKGFTLALLIGIVSGTYSSISMRVPCSCMEAARPTVRSPILRTK